MQYFVLQLTDFFITIKHMYVGYILELSKPLFTFAVQSYGGVRVDILRATQISMGLAVHLPNFHSIKVP